MNKIRYGFKAIALLLSFIFALNIGYAQEKTVTGIVTDESGQTLPGATIVVDGTSNGAISDLDGKFLLAIPEGYNKLLVSFVGLETQQILVGSKTHLEIVLKNDLENLDEVIVTGYTTQKKADITGAIATVDMGEVHKQTSPNIVGSLQGRMAGVKISNDGTPSGGNAKVLIRGVGTLNNTDPLYIIDGIPTKSGMHELNSSDIESIQVLKDAASASIYGSRASNGVIIITTKQGKQGKANVSFNAYTSASFYNQRQEVLNAEQYGNALWSAMTNDGLDPNTNPYSYTFDWSADQDGSISLNKILLPEYLDSDKTMRPSNTDWFDEISGVGVVQNYDMSVSSGNDRGSSLFSLGYYNNKGIIETSEFSRISARINTKYDIIKDVLTIGENFSFSKTSELIAPGDILNVSLRALPIIPVKTEDGEGWGGPVGGMNDRHNPVRLLEYNKDNNYDYTRLFGNAYLELKPIKNLAFKTSIGIDNNFYYKRALQRSYKSGYLENDKTAVTIDQFRSEKWTWSNTATYKLDANKHSFNFLLGAEMHSDFTASTYQRKEDFLVETPEYMYPDAGTGEAYTGGNTSGYRLMSYFGKVDYSFDNKYLASATVRHDGSSRFSSNNRFGTFPSFSLGWRMSQEDFIKEANTPISDLKLRFSWGQTGNQEIANNAIYSIYLADYAGGDPTWGAPNGTAYDFSGAGSGLLPSGYKMIQRANENLKWETTTQTNIGVDFGFWDQTLYGSVDYYIKNTDDILVLPPYLGAIGEGGSMWVNGASMENKGWEVSLGYNKTTNWGLDYGINANWSRNRNKVTALPESVVNNYGGNGKGDNILGRPVNSMYGYVADGLFRTESEVNNHVNQEGKGLGRIRYANLDGSDNINDEDRAWIGNPHPNSTFGINIDLKYKSFDFTAFFEGIGNVDIINERKRNTDFWSVDDVGSNKGTNLLNAWSASNPNSDIPALTTIDSNNENRMSTYFIENGKYFKLRNVQIGYTMPKKILDTMQLTNLRLYVSGQNLLTIKSSNFTGVDPENPAWGYPLPMTFTAGLSLTL